MVSFLNTSRYSKLQTQNSKHENGDLIIYCSTPATTHRQKIQRTLQDQNHEAGRYTCCCPRQHYRQKYVRIISIPAPYSPYAKGMTSQSHGEQHPLVNVNKGVKCGRIFGLYHKLVYIYKSDTEKTGKPIATLKSANKQFIGQMAAQTRLTKEQRAHEKNIQITENE